MNFRGILFPKEVGEGLSMGKGLTSHFGDNVSFELTNCPVHYGCVFGEMENILA